VTQFVIVALALALLVGMSWRANARFAHAARLPMQWSLSGSVNWTAPRRLALAFMPLLAAILLTGTAVAPLFTPPRGGQDVVSALATMAATLIGVHALHLWLIDRTLRAD